MKVESEIKIIHSLEVTDEELQAVEKTCEMLHKLVKLFPHNPTIMSLTTGEIVAIDELPLIMGTLTGIVDNVMWTEI